MHKMTPAELGVIFFMKVLPTPPAKHSFIGSGEIEWLHTTSVGNAVTFLKLENTGSSLGDVLSAGPIRII